jgi:hypothetical protein
MLWRVVQDILAGEAELASETSSDGEFGAVVPGDAHSDVMRHALVLRRAHVARRAGGRGGIILADDPLAARERHLVHIRPIRDPVLGLVVNLDLRMVGPHVALAAVGVRARPQKTHAVMTPRENLHSHRG